MFYRRELDFLTCVLDRCGIEARIIPMDRLGSVISESLERILPSLSGLDVVPSVSLKPETMHRLTDVMGRRFMCLPLAEREGDTLLIGPYLNARQEESMLLLLGEQVGIPPKSQKWLNEYMSSLPLITAGDTTERMINAFSELMWKTAAFPIVDTAKPDLLSPSPLITGQAEAIPDEAAINILAVEKRYAFENEMIQAVAAGQIHRENQLLVAVNGNIFERRVSDPLRNAKNYGIIMNTLLRKAAESGGVHPVYIDRTSSLMAAKIEELQSADSSAPLMHEMYRTYCRLVRRHSTAKYSPVVQRTIISIDSDLSGTLSLSSLAKAQGISPGYLATVFKREVGVTVSKYIREKRMKHAEHLLKTTSLQVQTVALHCGILDVQYFSKLFKRHTGKTPKEYRETEKRG